MKKIIDYLFYRYYLISIKNCYNGLFVCCADIVVSLNWRFLFTQYIRENKNNNRDNRLFSALAYHLSTLQQKKNKRFIGKISKQQIQYQIFRQGGVKPPLYSTNSRADSDAVTLSVQINYNISYIYKVNGMKDLMEKYYNVIYYCAYKILFYFLYRLINPFYWIRLKKWNNNYINRIILISKKIETDAADKGIIVWISVMAITSVYRISLWIIAVVCIIGIQFPRIKITLITAFISDSIFYPLLIVIGLFVYYINDYFLFKNDKYRKYFKQFDKEKKYVQYYSIYLISIIIQFTTFYILLKSL